MKSLSLTRGLETLVDDADFPWLSQWKWHAVENRNGFYAKRQVRVGPNKQRAVALHRILVDAREDQLVDHRDGNTLNNQRYNLRVCGPQESSYNRGRYNKRSVQFPFKGVGRNRKGAYTASITANKKRVSLFGFKTAREAALAYDALAVKYHGEFARTNAMLGLL